MTRRRALKVLTAGTGLTLTAASPLFSRIARGACSTSAAGSSSTPPKNLIVIFANGGLRTPDCWDFYSSGEIWNTTTGYFDSLGNTIGCQGKPNDWDLPSWASALYSGTTDWTEKMTVVRNVNFVTASHPTGKIYALNGRNATTKPAGPVIVGNDTDWDTLVGGVPNLKSWNMGYPLTAGGKEPSIPGDPSDLADLFDNVGYAGGSAGDLPDLSIASALTADNGRFSLIPSIASRFFEWWDPSDKNGVDETAGELLEAGISETFNGPDYNTYLDAYSAALGTSGTQIDSERFAGAVSAIKSGVGRVITIAMQTSFDTHTATQQSLISDLCTYIATTMELLDTEGLLDETLILVTSDFDRTPKYNTRSGTDHLPAGAVAFFGAGLNYGAFGPKRDTLETVHYDLDLSTLTENASSGETINREHIWATVLDFFGIDSSLHFNTGKPISAIQG